MTSPRTRDVVFVANDVGGAGGMERHTEELIKRLLDTGRSVTVVARTCAMPTRSGLRFVRVPTPRRPFTIAYPAFFLVASAIVARVRGNALVHTTGAIVLNRADLSTIHYCHEAAGRLVASPRASRSSRAYRINAAIAAVMARAAERWCYRPGCTRVLCAVSDGVGDELRRSFPAMNAAIRSIPNGVDTTSFSPDPAARARLRERLSVAHDAPLALFAGGDWERKGLAFAVAALAQAPSWHLAVAGPGDQQPLVTTADASGTADRLHLLGRVSDMPSLYAAADAFVFPTTYEAFPLVVLEAAASGLPLLVTPVNGARDIVRDGINGWLISRDAHDIARRMNDLAADPERARQIGEAARASVSSYTWDAMAERYSALYDERSAPATHPST